MGFSIVGVTYHLGTDDVAPLSIYDVPVAQLPQTNTRQRVPVMAIWRLCTFSLEAHFVATIHFKFIGFNGIKFLQSKNIFVLTEALRYHKQLSTSFIVVGDIIIGKSFDKLVKARDCKCGWPFAASEIGRSSHLVAVTWKYKKRI